MLLYLPGYEQRRGEVPGRLQAAPLQSGQLSSSHPYIQTAIIQSSRHPDSHHPAIQQSCSHPHIQTAIIQTCTHPVSSPPSLLSLVSTLPGQIQHRPRRSLTYILPCLLAAVVMNIPRSIFRIPGYTTGHVILILLLATQLAMSSSLSWPPNWPHFQVLGDRSGRQVLGLL